MVNIVISNSKVTSAIHRSQFFLVYRLPSFETPLFPGGVYASQGFADSPQRQPERNLPPKPTRQACEQGTAFAVQDVLAGEVGNQGGLSGARLADDVHVGAAVGALDAEGATVVAEVGLGKQGECGCAAGFGHNKGFLSA